MLQRHLATTMLVSAVTSSASPAFAEPPIWESQQPIFTPQPYAQPYQQQRQAFAPSRPGNFQPQMQLAAYHKPQLPAPIERGLRSLAQVLDRENPRAPTPLAGGSITHGDLAATVRELLDWQGPTSPDALSNRFDLVNIPSATGNGLGKFTGYFTPELQGSRVRTQRFNIPVYRMPAGNVAHLSHAEIANGALAGRGLELAWVDDPFALYIAQVQGAALIHFPNGSQQMIEYDGSNERSFSAISDYLRKRGYMSGSFTNADIHAWLRSHPNKAHEVMTSNQRYIFFRNTQEAPKTSSGGSVIPGHTIAVDHNHIPLGSVLLAELPRFDSMGNEVGTEWRLLFAQDRGKGVKGSGRMDLYTGIGSHAEDLAYKVSGPRRTFLLVRKAG